LEWRSFRTQSFPLAQPHAPAKGTSKNRLPISHNTLEPSRDDNGEGRAMPTRSMLRNFERRNLSTMTPLHRVTTALPLLFVVLAACGTTVPSISETADPDSGITEITDASVDVPFVPAPDAGPRPEPTCNTSPFDDARVVSERCGIFVAPDGFGGVSTNPGTRMRPLASIQAALELAIPGNVNWVFVCAGTYEEHVAMTSIHAGLRVFGGLACPGAPEGAWAPVKGRRAVVRQPAADAANAPEWRIERSALSVTLEALEITARDATEPSSSSVALLVRDCASVTLRDVVLRAGRGAAGVTGAVGDEGLVEDSYVPKVSDFERYGVSFRCSTGGTVSSGNGGNNAAPDGSAARRVLSTSGGEGGTQKECNAMSKGGRNGASGKDGAAGAGATSLGGLDGEVWRTPAGTPGTSGTPGEGGGGGAIAEVRSEPLPGNNPDNFGGGGGGGTCGGGGGHAGGGGGGSFTLMAFGSNVTVAASELTSGDGGAGGAGGAGRDGIDTGGHLGYRGYFPRGTGCFGGQGGQGGRGGNGGGGAGGPSFVVLADARSNVVTDAATTAATKVGAAGQGGAGLSQNGGRDGEAARLHTIEAR
jgi:hypothetical protein